MFFKPDLVGIQTLHARREFHHWCPKSEKFASTSQLFSAVIQGWRVSTTVIRRACHFSGGRQTSVYYFELRRHGDYMTMPVLESPTVIRLVMLNPFEVVDYRQRLRMATHKKAVGHTYSDKGMASVG